eukprot:GEMP01080321.1.p1 GENE.GEMP01080321.1~~GEMP01080321.1.p1  ORF type:complete len:122 (-),score=32.74 GEMP01080321.1:131-496(-)
MEVRSALSCPFATVTAIVYSYPPVAAAAIADSCFCLLLDASARVSAIADAFSCPSNAEHASVDAYFFLRAAAIALPRSPCAFAAIVFHFSFCVTGRMMPAPHVVSPCSAISRAHDRQARKR